MNKQFKVGDQVVRVGVSNAPGASLGQRAEVVRVHEGGDVRVSYKDCSSEFWLNENTDYAPYLCKFVPGNTYKDEEGREYKFLLHVPEASSPYERAVFLNKYGSVVLRNEDGDHSTPRSRLDILPNKETRTIFVYRMPSNRLVASDDRAAEIPQGWKLIGEVKEEVEVY